MFGRLSNNSQPQQKTFSPVAAAEPTPDRAPPPQESVALPPDYSARYLDLKLHLHQQLLDMMNLKALDKMEPGEIRAEVEEMIKELLVKEQTPVSLAERNRLIPDILDEVIGLGPLEPLLKDPTISDILANTHDNVYVERQGRLELTPVKFKDDRHLIRIIKKIVSGVGRRIDESQPLVDARLADGSRVNAVIPPLAVDGPLLSIRKFAKIPFTIDSLISNGSITPEIAELLSAIVHSRLNVLISGGTGSGKTTMLNAMSCFISNRERILTIEDAAELQLQQPHVARLETRPANIEGTGAYSQRDLVKNALRMRPDRIIVGEVRAGEAFDMLQAMNTGHEGSMTTIHANTPRDALSRLEQMIGMSGLDLPTRTMRAQIASALNVVIQLQRMSDGRRRLVSLYEITGMEGDVVSLQEIFFFKRLSTDEDGTIHGEFRATGIRPKLVDECAAKGIKISPDLFTPDRPLG